jgi:hypothetical protein
MYTQPPNHLLHLNLLKEEEKDLDLDQDQEAFPVTNAPKVQGQEVIHQEGETKEEEAHPMKETDLYPETMITLILLRMV